ncbi:hypothetical protein BG003_001963 [Podila horticola]|nr:hypothetical protein BG003_001963 [Podila horticola]
MACLYSQAYIHSHKRVRAFQASLSPYLEPAALRIDLSRLYLRDFVQTSSSTCTSLSSPLPLAAAAAMVQAAPTSVKRSETVAQGSAANSPGWGSGNVLNIPIAAPINGCGNSVNWIGGLNNAGGNACVGH